MDDKEDNEYKWLKVWNVFKRVFSGKLRDFSF